MRDEYISQLNKVYEKYYDKDGYCCFYHECKRTIPNSEEKFLFDRANVGDDYGNDTNIPKIVIIGLEGLGKQGQVQKIGCPSDSAFNPHYKGVRYVLAYILSKLGNNIPPCNSLKKELLKYNDTIYKYTLLNCYKCAFANRASNLPHTEKMKEHCQKILFEEIRTLEPDFIIIQIKNDRPINFEENLKNTLGFDEQKEIAGDSYTGAYLLTRKNEPPTILIWTYHGSGSPYHDNRCWTNDNKKGCRYIRENLNPILDSAIKAYCDNTRKQHAICAKSLSGASI